MRETAEVFGAAALAVFCADDAVVVFIESCLEDHGGLNIVQSVNAASLPVSTNLPITISQVSFHVQSPPIAVGVGITAYFQPELYHTIAFVVVILVDDGEAIVPNLQTKYIGML